MKFNRLLLTGLMLAGLLAYVSCSKVDSLPQNQPSSKNSEDRFFHSHRTADPIEKVLVEFIKRRNDKEHFVEKTVTQMGYPNWEKTMAVKTLDKKVSVIQNTNPDSISIYYIPFVRETQNYVNASFVVTVTPTDTLLTNLIDHQYTQLPNDASLTIDGSEKHVLFFMLLDYIVFGYKDFQITDSLLFNNGQGKADIVHIELQQNNNLNQNGLLAMPAGPVCINATLSLTGCSQCPGNESYEQCWEDYYGLWDSNSGTPGSGTGGGGGGFTPIPTLTSIDVSSINDPCLQAVIQNIGAVGHNSFILKTYFDQNFNTTGAQKKYKVKYFTNTTLIGNNGQPIPGKTNLTTLSDGTNEVEITLNPSFFQTTTKEWVTTIILHELLQGIILVERPDLNTSLLQHVWMFDNKAPLTIAQSLMELFPIFDLHNAIALGMDGMSEGYIIPNTNTIDPAKDVFAQQNYFQNINQAILTASNYQNSVASFGTSFC